MRSALNGKASPLSPIKLEMIFIVLFVSGGGMLEWLEKLEVFIPEKIVGLYNRKDAVFLDELKRELKREFLFCVCLFVCFHFQKHW